MLEDWDGLQLTERHAGQGEAEQLGAEERGRGSGRSGAKCI